MPTGEDSSAAARREKAKRGINATPEAVTSGTGHFPTNELEVIRRALQSISDRYELLEEAGHGSWGVVYRARDLETDEIVALKVLRPDLASDLSLLERFKRELRLARRITHKNVCRVYDLQRTSSVALVTMEFIDGENLRSFLHLRSPLKLEEGLNVARQVCAALHEAHGQGVIHRDLKPENIMLDRSGLVKVMDFGIARSVDTISTSTGGLLGTPAYMSPEQAKGELVDPRADIYSLGLILFEIFTGVVAFTADSPLALAWKQVHEPPTRPRALEPSLPSTLERVILRCLEKDPGRRYQTAAELDEALARVLLAESRQTADSQRTPWFLTATADDLPRLPRLVPLTLLMLIQVLFLILYLVALAKFGSLRSALDQQVPSLAEILTELIRLTGIVGIGLRLYIASAIAFDYKGLGDDFRRLSFILVPLDVLWALSPLLLLAAGKLGSLAFACTMALAFLPFTQRTLVRMLFP